MTAKEVNISNELKALEQKKSALEKIMKIGRAVEQLRYSLEAAVLLGKPTAAISSQALHIFEALSEKIRIQPTKKIQESVKKLDALIANHLNAILELAQPENHAELQEQIASDDALASHIDKLIQDYRKNSQTSVALRVVLRERGVPTSPIKWSINTESIRAQITQLSQRESHYRKKVKSEIILLQHDALSIANNGNLPQPTRNSAAYMHKMLQKDLDHLNAGKDLASMPFFVEVVELQESKPEESRQDNEAKPQQPPPPASATVPPIQSTQTEPQKKSGFMHKLWRWTTTPPSVTWQDIEEQSKKDL